MNIYPKKLSSYLSKKLFSTKGHGPLILMYHGTPTGEEKVESIYSLKSDMLCRHLDYLAYSGWHTACVRDLGVIENFPPQTVILTFDDGFANNYEGAYLPLLERGMRATWFITSGCIGSNSIWLEKGKNKKMLTKEQLLEMHINGMEIGSHTVTHPDLSILTQEEIDNELEESKLQIEEIIDQPVISFAYPYGRFNKLALRSVEQCDFSYACSTRPGWYNSNNGLFELPRITIFEGDSLGTFVRKLAFAANDVSWKQVGRYYLQRMYARVGR